VRIVDRTKDLIKSGGEWISSVELETELMNHPKIAEAAVIAMPSAMTEDDIKVCIVPEGDLEPRELFDFFKEKLPYFAIPRYVQIVDALPKTATMRVQKHVLRAMGVTSSTWDLEQLGLVVARDERR
jgi:crotonobetaine/carnitine-CoA ligase